MPVNAGLSAKETPDGSAEQYRCQLIARPGGRREGADLGRGAKGKIGTGRGVGLAANTATKS